MPLMIENDDMENDEMDVMEDLFGDGAGLSLPSRPPSKELCQRLDELRGSGCCQGIAWSKWGSIATVAPNGTSVELRNLRCHPENGTWALSEQTVLPNLSTALDGGPVKHLSWSPTGSDLAVIDTAGRIAILNIFASLNKPILNRNCQLDLADDLHGVVGCYWLNMAPYPTNRGTAMVQGPAVKDGLIYKYEQQQGGVLGPSHPNPSKSAFVCLTTNGILRLLWPQNTGKWCESHTELESIVSSDDLITHAAICPDKTGLLIAFATSTKQLCTVRASVEWNATKIEKVPPQHWALNPTIKITRHMAVTSWLHDTSTDNVNTSHTELSMVQLSHLEFLPTFADASGRMAPPTILTIRSHLPVSNSHYDQDVNTAIDRWEVNEKPQAIHPAFEQLSSRRNSVGSQPGSVIYLKKLESITVNKILIALESMNIGRVIFLAYADGSVEYRDRVSMAETFNDNDLDRVWHLSQIGFSYPDEEPCLQVALSPSYCSLVHIRNDGKVKWKHLDYQLGDIGSSMEDGLYAGVVAAFSLSCTTAVLRNVNYDDLLATAKKHATAQFAYDWLTELSRILNLKSDYSEETHHDVLVRNTTIQLCLCIQNSLGFKGEFTARTFSGKFAWLVLQLRNIVVLVTMAANLNVTQGGPNSEKTTPLEDPEVINSLAGSVRWVLDLMAWLTDTLLDLPKNLPSAIDPTRASDLSLPELLCYLHSTNTISLHLLLSSPTRGFLTAICRRLQHLDYIARKAIQTPNPQNSSANHQHPSTLSPALRAAYLQIATLTTNSIVRIKTIETLLGSLTSLIRTAYAANTPPLSGSQGAEKMRNALEIKMLFGGSFPDAFKSVIVELFKKEGLLDAVKDDIDPPKLFFADFSMLEVDEDALMVGRRKALHKTMDCFQKRWLVNPEKKRSSSDAAGGPSNAPSGESTTSENFGLMGAAARQGARWRRCARCASVMEDVLMQRSSLQWLVMQQRRCFCSGYWDTLPPGEMVA